MGTSELESEWQANRPKTQSSLLSGSARLCGKKGILKLGVVFLFALVTTQANAIESFNTDWRSDSSDVQSTPDQAGPIYTTDDRWVTPVVLVIFGLFLAAGIAGPIVLAERPEMVPPAMSHEEDPAVDRH